MNENSNIQIRVFEESEDWRLLSKAWINFCRQEVVHSAVRAVHTPEGQRLQDNILRDCVVGNEFPILVAWDQLNNKVAGFVLHQIQIKGIPVKSSAVVHMSQPWDDEAKSEFQDVVDFYVSQAQNSNYYEKYNVSELWKILVLAIDPEYTRRGIATSLIRKSVELAEEREMKLVVSNFSSSHTQKIAFRMGFETVYEGIYSEKFALYHQIPQDIRMAHRSCLAMAKKL